MPKPLGIGIYMGCNGEPGLRVNPTDRTVDQIWDAVRDAICANMTPEEFKREAAAAWESYLREDAKAALKVFGS